MKKEPFNQKFRIYSLSVEAAKNITGGYVLSEEGTKDCPADKCSATVVKYYQNNCISAKGNIWGTYCAHPNETAQSPSHPSSARDTYLCYAAVA